MTIAIVGVAGRARGQCKRGTSIFRFDASTANRDAEPGTVEVETTGAWTSPAGHGCLDRERLRRVRAAVKAAKTAEVAKGAFLETPTAIAIQCVAAAIDASSTPRQVAGACGPTACVRGTRVLRVRGRWHTDDDGWKSGANDVTMVTMADGSLPPYTPAPTTEVQSTGAWSRGDGNSGCLDAVSLGLLRRSVARARFRTGPPDPACRESPMVDLVYEGPTPRQRVRTMTPCGGAVDDDTALAGRCLQAVTDVRLLESEVDDACID